VLRNKRKNLAFAVIITFILSTNLFLTSCSLPLTRGSLNDGLVTYYPMNEGGGSNVLDSSNNGNDGTIYNASWTTDSKDGYALSFDGQDDYLEIADANSLDLAATHSISLWICVRDLAPWISGNGHRLTLLKKYDTNRGYAITISDDVSQLTGVVTYFIGNSVGYKSISSNTALAEGKWYNVAVTYDGTYLRIYINGALDVSKEIGAQGIGATANLRIGTPYDYGFDGIIDEIRIYDRALKADEIEQLYQGGAGDFSISASETTLSINPGNSDISTITVTSHNGFSETVTLSSSWVGISPSGVTTSFSVNPITPPSDGSISSTLTIAVNQFCATGTYTLTITGTAGETTLSTTISITISAQPGTHNFEVRPGATKITITCTWRSSGNIVIILISPSITYEEADMTMYERITIRTGEMTTYNYLKRTELTISTPTTEETWILQLTPQGVTAYTVDIEIT